MVPSSGDREARELAVLIVDLGRIDLFDVEVGAVERAVAEGKGGSVEPRNVGIARRVGIDPEMRELVADVRIADGDGLPGSVQPEVVQRSRADAEERMRIVVGVEGERASLREGTGKRAFFGDVGRVPRIAVANQVVDASSRPALLVGEDALGAVASELDVHLVVAAGRGEGLAFEHGELGAAASVHVTAVDAP